MLIEFCCSGALRKRILSTVRISKIHLLKPRDLTDLYKSRDQMI